MNSSVHKASVLLERAQINSQRLFTNDPLNNQPDIENDLLQKIDKMEQVSTRIQQMSSNLLQNQQNSMHNSCKNQIENMNELMLIQNKQTVEYFHQLEHAFMDISTENNVKKSMVDFSNNDDSLKSSKFTKSKLKTNNNDDPIINEIKSLKLDIKNIKISIDKINQNEIQPISFPTLETPKLKSFNYNKIKSEIKRLSKANNLFDSVGNSYMYSEQNFENLDDLIQNMRIQESVDTAIKNVTIEKNWIQPLKPAVSIGKSKPSVSALKSKVKKIPNFGTKVTTKESYTLLILAFV
jgi:hypothetical protein